MDVISYSKTRTWVAILLPAAVAWLLTFVCIYVFRYYGWAMFMLIPIFIGAGATVLYAVGKAEVHMLSPVYLTVLSMTAYAILLLFMAIEGIICIIMAMPFGMAFASLGAYLGLSFVRLFSNDAPKVMFLLAGLVPLVSYVEQDTPAPVAAVVTAIDIDAPPQTVWNYVTAFPALPEPDELIFQAGVAYPTGARIEGSGVGAVRHCQFTTGAFVEPVTTWDPPRLLAFDVTAQPAPMKELSFWDVDAPHLHGYFRSTKGQFMLTPLPNGGTRLEGTTWYAHRIQPAVYWRLWSDYILHKIHTRVLEHIKTHAEAV